MTVPNTRADSAAARALRPQKVSLLPSASCSVGCPVLDRFLDGGLPCGVITELSGEAAAGKTQICLQSLLAVQLPPEFGGLDGRGIYIYTEVDPAMGRLEQLAHAFPARVARQHGESAMDKVPKPEHLLSDVLIKTGIHTGQDLLVALQSFRPLLMSQASRRGAIKLIVVDSIAHVFRGSDAALAFGAKTKLLFSIASLLRRYAEEFNLAVLVTNQIQDCLNGSAVPPPWTSAPLWSWGRMVQPALGLAWSHCVHVRLFLSKGGAGGSEPETWRAEQAQPSASPPIKADRRMRLVFAPHVEPRATRYVVRADGVAGA